jgi:hypothetical protein
MPIDPKKVDRAAKNFEDRLQKRVSTKLYAEQLKGDIGDSTPLGERVASNFNAGYGLQPVAALNDQRKNAPQYHMLAGVLETQDAIKARRAPKKGTRNA